MQLSRPVVFICFLLSATLITPAMAQNLVAMFSISGDRQVGSIDPTTGIATLNGSPINGGSPMNSFGGSGYDASTNTLYIVGNPGAVNSVVDVALPAGTVSTVALTGNNPNSVEYDVAEATIYAVFSVAGDRQAGSINTATGVVTMLGSPIGGVSISTSANATLDATGNRLFFVGTPTAGVASIYTVNTGTGAATVQALSPASIISMLAYNSTNGTLYALVSVGGGGRQLGTINPGTGAVALSGSAFDGGASISTTSDGIAIDEATGTLYFAGNTSSIYTVNLTTGAATSQTITGGGTSVVSLEFDPGALPVTLSRFSVD